jgi:hypothetical protein
MRHYKYQQSSSGHSRNPPDAPGPPAIQSIYHSANTCLLLARDWFWLSSYLGGWNDFGTSGVIADFLRILFVKMSLSTMVMIQMNTHKKGHTINPSIPHS